MASMSSIDELYDLLVQTNGGGDYGRSFAKGWIKVVALRASQESIDQDIEFIKDRLNKEKEKVE
jgi:hypothetical protein